MTKQSSNRVILRGQDNDLTPISAKSMNYAISFYRCAILNYVFGNLIVVKPDWTSLCRYVASEGIPGLPSYFGMAINADRTTKYLLKRGLLLHDKSAETYQITGKGKDIVSLQNQRVLQK